MSNETPPPFVPFAPNFQPPGASPPLQPEQTPPKETKKQKTAREKREAAAAKKAAEQVPDKPTKPPRKRRTVAAKPAKRAPKFDLQAAMKIGAELSDLGEQTVFLKLFNDLSALPKKVCKRIVGALATALLNDA